ncbi:MAG: S41 family peptidase [Dysosmobacter welbionis]
MKHAWKKLLAAAVLPCLLAGCGALGGPESEVPSMDHLLGLTQEQRLEDYDYLVQTLGDSYLCMGVRDRDNPEDPSAAIFQAYREMIQESDSDEVFYSAVYSTLFRLGTYGHLWIVEPDMYRAYCEAYEDGGIQDREHWREVLTDPVTVRGYERLQTLLDAYGEEDGTVNSADSEEPAANLHTLLLPGGDVGYVKIDSFPAEYEDSYATDRAALTDFYRQAADCTDLIIDLTDNSGGSEVYWQQLLAAPLTDRPLSCTNYALLARAATTAPISRRCSPRRSCTPSRTCRICPSWSGTDPGRHPLCGEHPLCGASGRRAPFHGRIWVLVGPAVYSASESFAVFCQETGFATLVGSPTGGDGIGALDPVFLQLPNSGILVQFTMMFGLNGDGSSSEETGTTPDILSPPGNRLW